MTHTAPHPMRVRFHSPELGTNVLRGVGSRIRCPQCPWSMRGRSWSELRAAYRQHIAEEHS